MNGRGRPPTPDILTPREYEVLELLRLGLTNREIGARLSISLAGAKFHVSEIITKLGVENREEAAMWQRKPARRWAFAPLAGLREWWGDAVTPLIAKGAVVAAVPVFAAGIGAGVWQATSRDGGSGNEASMAAPNPDDPCGSTHGCFVIREKPYTTLQEARQFASFEPMMPAYLPAGYKQQLVLGTDRSLMPNQHVGNPVEVHNDWITIIYRNDAGGQIVISQGFPARPGLFTVSETAPSAERGATAVGDREARWARGVPLTMGPQRLLGAGLVFEVGRFGIGWAISPEGSYFSGSPMSYFVGSDSLSLDELKKIAESVKLPPMLPPLNGATPPRPFQ
jgi:DNA-binding CsgD family transcriptional regulator